MNYHDSISRDGTNSSFDFNLDPNSSNDRALFVRIRTILEFVPALSISGSEDNCPILVVVLFVDGINFSRLVTTVHQLKFMMYRHESPVDAAEPVDCEYFCRVIITSAQ